MTDVANVVVAGNGGIWVGDENDAAPTFAADPGAGWDELGYATEDGVEISSERTVTGVNAWQALGAIRNLTTDAPLSVAFTCIEVTPFSVRLAFAGGSVDSATGIYTPGDPGEPDMRALFVRGIDGAYTFDWWFPRAQLQGTSAINLQRIQETRVPIEMGVLFSDPRFTMQTDHPAFKTGP